MAKQHFVFLDGLRGFAALTVGILHADEVFQLNLPVHHAALAVDFFFCLSGFVVAYAYDDRLRDGMKVHDFIIRRLIRLYPMIFSGIVLGFIVTQLGLASHRDVSEHELIVITAASFLLVPAGLFFHLQVFPINTPMWSLFFEIIANVAYAFEKKLLRSLAVVSIAILAAGAAALTYIIHKSGTVESVGFIDIASFFWGFARVLYPFLAGVLIYRYSLFTKYALRFALIPLALLLAILLVPYWQPSWIFDSVAILVAFPLIVIFGAGVPNTGPLRKVWDILGRLSYPFYIIHQPTLRAINQVFKHLPQLGAHPLIFSTVGVLAAGILSYLLLLAYDQPVRRWLTGLIARRLNEPAVSAAGVPGNSN